MPSIFDVMNNHTMYLAKWHLQNKNIDLGIQYDALNAYRVVCKISQPQLEKQQKEKYNQVNKKSGSMLLIISDNVMLRNWLRVKLAADSGHGVLENIWQLIND